MKLKEITVFTKGDSNQIKTWSNVPFFLTETLISKGIKVNRVNIGPPHYLNKIFTILIANYIRKFTKNKDYDFIHSYIYYLYAIFKIKRTIKKYPTSDANLFITFLFSSAGFSNKPTIMFGDWTYDYRIEHHLGRKPGWFEKQCIKRQTRHIQKSDLVIALFPMSGEYIQRKSKSKVSYLGNVINSAIVDVRNNSINNKKESNAILFIGRNHYIEGAVSLIKSFQIIKSKIPSASLHIIGIDKKEFDELPESVHCYGYLNKGIDSERELYYDILKKAKLFINTTPKWAAFSASIEAMYYYTPVVITPSGEFVTTFGEDIKFGFYCYENTPEFIVSKITQILTSENYELLCKEAHDAVKQFTWDTYMDKFINLVENKLTKL